MKTAWKRLVRFEDTQGRTLYGEPILPSADFDIGKVKETDGLKAKIISGSDIFDTTGKTFVSDETATVKKLLSPLKPEDVPILRCVGLNYAKHSKLFTAVTIHGLILYTVKEAGRTPPPYPFIFFKPNTCVVGPGEAVIIPKIAQDDQADYEGELVSHTPISMPTILRY
jgi:2-keto-4-pentenoate hydratase/2-oxohepta-3-ene-1,7-dioic acid hydratase in catechol pathway